MRLYPNPELLDDFEFVVVVFFICKLVLSDPDSDDVEILNRYIMHYLTPETSTTHHYWWSYSDDFTPNIPEVKEMMTLAFDKIFSEDAWACGHMQKLLDNDTSEYTELVTGGDKAGLLFRRIVLGWVEDECEAPT